MNRKPLSRSILLMIVGVVLLTLTVILSQQRHENTLVWRAEAQRASEALSSVEAIRARTSEAERDRFGYGVTSDKALLGQARSLLNEASEERDRLSPRLGATASQRQRLELLTGLLKDAQDLRLPGEIPTVHPVETPVPQASSVKPLKSKSAPATQTTPAASPILTLPKVRELGDLTREVLRDLTQGEVDARTRALINAGWSDRTAEWILLGGSAAALICLLMGFLGLRGETLRLQRELDVQEKVLQESQDMLHQVDDGLVLLDPFNGAVVASNDRFAANSGYPRGQLTEGLVRPFLPADPSAPTGDIIRLLARAIREGSCAEKVRLHPRTGPDRLVRASFRRLTLSGQTRVLAVFSDIEALENARREAERERDHLRQFLLPASSPALLLDPEDGHVMDATPEAALLFGTDVEALIDGRLYPLAPGEGSPSRETLLSYFEKALSLEPQNFEWSTLSAQKRLVPFAVSLQRITVSGHDRLLALLKDLSAEKQLRAEFKDLKTKYDASSQNEKALRQDVLSRTERESKMKEENTRLAEERNRLLAEKDGLSRPLSSVSGVVFALGLDGTYRLLEGRDLLKLGLAPGELTGRKAVDSPRGPLRSLLLIQRALAGESFTALEEAGGLLWEIHLSPLRDSSGHPDGCVGIALDVTEREKARQALQYRLDSIVALLESSPDAFFLADHEGQVAFACGSGFEALGLSPWDAQSKTMDEIFPDAEIWKQSRQKALEEGSSSMAWENSGETYKGFIARIKPAGSDATLLGGILRHTGSVVVPEPPSVWKGVSEAAPIGLVVLRSDGIIRSLNPAAAHLLHQNPKSPVGSTWVSMANESNLSAWDASLEKWRSGQFGSIRLPFTLGDSEIDLEVSAAPLITGDASSDWIVALDLAPEKVPEPEPPSLWKGVSEAAPIGLVVLRSDGIIRSLNPAAAHLLHQNAESPVGSTWVSMANESNLSAWDASLEKWRSGQFGSIRLPFTLGDSEIDLEVSAAPLITGDASSDWIVALDLAPEKVPEPEPPSLWKGVSEAAPIGLVVLRSDGIIRSLNPAAAQLLHRSEEASVGSTWVSMASEPGLAAWNDSLEKWRKGQFDSVHLPFLANGTDLELEAAAAPFVASDASSDWIVALQPAPAKPPESNSLDSFLRLERSQREILLATGPSVSRLLEDIADIRRNTVGLREKAGWAINPDGLNHINQLEESAQDAAQRLEGWFDYQMAMTRELHYTAVDLSLIAKETADIRKADFDRVGAVLTVRDLPMIEADPDLLHMMFRNLYDFTLSQKLAGTHPQVLVRATIVRAPEKSASPGWCQLSLEFDSPVTTEEELEHLFQVAAKPSEKVPGGSLGLLTVRRIAERHGGTVSAQPREGGGVSLIVVLPLLAPKAS